MLLSFPSDAVGNGILDEDLLNSLEVDGEGKPVVDDSNQTMASKTQEVLYYYEGMRYSHCGNFCQ